MNLDDEPKPGQRPREAEAEGKRQRLSADDDLLGDVEFDLIEETDDPPPDDVDADVFARDTAIPASPPEQLAAEAMRNADAHERGTLPRAARDKPKLPTPPAARVTRHTPATIEPPTSGDVDFDPLDTPIDVFGHALPGTRQPAPGKDGFGESEVPTAPPNGGPSSRDRATRTRPGAEQPGRAAFLAETTRNRPIDPELLARLANEDPEREDRRGTGGGRDADSDALDFIDGLDPLLESLSPKANLEPPPPPSSTTRAGLKELEERYAVGDYTTALQIAEDLLARSPDDLAARRYAQNCRDVLTQMFAARIGPLDQVITVMVSPEEVQWLSLDHRAGFLLSLVDGQSTVDEILDISGMTRLDALKIIHDLTEQHVVRLI